MTALRKQLPFLIAAVLHVTHVPNLKRLPNFPGIVIEIKEGAPTDWGHADESVEIRPMDFGTPSPPQVDCYIVTGPWWIHLQSYGAGAAFLQLRCCA